MPGLVNSVDSEDIRLDHGITGIANIPNQIHHEERRRSHQINIALVGDAGLGKTRFINNCLKKQIFPTGQQQSLIDTGTGVKVRIRQARLREAGVEATLNLVDVPSCSLSHDRHTCFSALQAYAQDRIEEYVEVSRQVERPLNYIDKRIDLALFFVNGLTTTQLTAVELEAIEGLGKLTNVIVVIAKSDSLLPFELLQLQDKILKQIDERQIGLFAKHAYTHGTSHKDDKQRKANLNLSLESILIPRLIPQILRPDTL